MTVLFLTTIVPGGRRTGSEVASAEFVAAIRAAGHRAIVLGYRRAGSDPPLAPDDVVAADRHIETRGAGARPAAWMARALAGGLPYSLAKYRTRRYERAVAALLARERPAVVVLDHAQAAWAIPRGGPGRPWAYLAHNVEHRLYEEAAARARGAGRWANRRETRRIEAVERRLVAEASRVWTLSEQDARDLAALGAARPPRRFDLPPALAGRGDERDASAAQGDECGASGAATSDPGAAVEQRFDVGLLGTWTWDANAAGLRWFLSDVRGRLPASLRVAVAGAGAPGGDGVTTLGVVSDAAAFLRSARVVAVPSVAGGGVQVKTLDAIGAGVPVVATRVALRGIPDPPPTVRVADEPEDFARAVREALAAADDAAAVEAARAWSEERRQRFRANVADAVRELAA